MDVATTSSPEQPSAIHPGRLSNKVRFAPMGEWVERRTPDYSYDRKAGRGRVILLIDHQQHLETRESYVHVAERMESLQAVTHSGQWRVVYDPLRQGVTIHSVRIVRDGQSTEMANPEAFRWMQREELLEAQVLDGSLTGVLLLEDLRIGDVIESEVTYTDKPLLCQDDYATLHIIPSNMAVAAYSVRVVHPDTANLQWRSSDDVGPPTAATGPSGSIWTWFLRNLDIRCDEATPGWVMPQSWLQVSTFSSWTEVAEGVWRAWPALDSPGMAICVENLSGRGSPSTDGIEAVIRFVQDEIRYLSVNVEFGGHIPSAPEITLRRKFGDCKDKAILLTALLRAIGVNARPILVNTSLQEGVSRFLPCLTLFNHVIVGFDFDDATYLVDTTVAQQGGGLRRASRDFGVGLSLGTGGKLEAVSPANQPHAAIRATEYFELAPPGSNTPSFIRVTKVSQGSAADFHRLEHALSGHAEYSRAVCESFREAYGGEPRSEYYWMDDRDSNVIETRAEYDAIRVFSLSHDHRTGSFGWGAQLIQSCLAVPNLETRREPFELPLPCVMEQQLELRGAFLGGHPPRPKVDVRHTNLIFAASAQTRRGHWLMEYRLEILRSRVVPDDFPSLLGALKRIWPALSLGFDVPVNLEYRRSHWKSPGRDRGLKPGLSPERPQPAMPIAAQPRQDPLPLPPHLAVAYTRSEAARHAALSSRTRNSLRNLGAAAAVFSLCCLLAALTLYNARDTTSSVLLGLLYLVGLPAALIGLVAGLTQRHYSPKPKRGVAAVLVNAVAGSLLCLASFVPSHTGAPAIDSSIVMRTTLGLSGSGEFVRGDQHSRSGAISLRGEILRDTTTWHDVTAGRERITIRVQDGTYFAASVVMVPSSDINTVASEIAWPTPEHVVAAERLSDPRVPYTSSVTVMPPPPETSPSVDSWRIVRCTRLPFGIQFLQCDYRPANAASGVRTGDALMESLVSSVQFRPELLVIANLPPGSASESIQTWVSVEDAQNVLYFASTQLSPDQAWALCDALSRDSATAEEHKNAWFASRVEDRLLLFSYILDDQLEKPSFAPYTCEHLEHSLFLNERVEIHLLRPPAKVVSIHKANGAGPRVSSGEHSIHYMPNSVRMSNLATNCLNYLMNHPSSYFVSSAGRVLVQMRETREGYELILPVVEPGMSDEFAATLALQVGQDITREVLNSAVLDIVLTTRDLKPRVRLRNVAAIKNATTELQRL